MLIDLSDIPAISRLDGCFGQDGISGFNLDAAFIQISQIIGGKAAAINMKHALTKKACRGQRKRPAIPLHQRFTCDMEAVLPGGLNLDEISLALQIPALTIGGREIFAVIRRNLGDFCALRDKLGREENLTIATVKYVNTIGIVIGLEPVSP